MAGKGPLSLRRLKKGKWDMAENIDHRSFSKKSAALDVVSLNGIHKKGDTSSYSNFTRCSS